jgi:hypothetical protein
VGDQCLIIRSLGSGHCEFRFSVCRPGGLGDALTALGDQCHLQRFNVVWKCAMTRIHATIESQIFGADS